MIERDVVRYMELERDRWREVDRYKEIDREKRERRRARAVEREREAEGNYRVNDFIFIITLTFIAVYI